MITKGVKALVIAPIDSSSLTDILQRAADAKIPVVSYDRLIRGTSNVDYYATFDNFKVGVLQASYIVDKLGLADGKGPFNIELFAGSPGRQQRDVLLQRGDERAAALSGQRQARRKSGQTSFDQVATLRWDGGLAQSRMDNLLSKAYTSGRVDAVLSPYDGMSLGIISALKSSGYGTRPTPCRSSPTGRRAGVGEVDHRRRADPDGVQGHPRAGQSRCADGGFAAHRRKARGQRHQDL